MFYINKNYSSRKFIVFLRLTIRKKLLFQEVKIREMETSVLEFQGKELNKVTGGFSMIQGPHIVIKCVG